MIHSFLVVRVYIFFYAILGLNCAYANTPVTNEIASKEIVFGYNPVENSLATENSGKQFSKYFKEKMGMNVKTFVASDYTALVEALRAGKIDFAWMPPFSFIKAEKLAKAVPLMKSVYRGKSEVYGAIIVRKDRNFNSINDLKGKSIAWVDPASATGHIFPKASLIRRQQIDPDKFFGKQIFAGGHDAVVLSVYNGTVDAGATYMANKQGEDGSWTQFLKTKEEQDKIKIIFTTDPMTSDVVVTSERFQQKNPSIVKKMVTILAGMEKNPDGKYLLNELYKVERLVPAKSSDYEPVREAARVLNLND